MTRTKAKAKRGRNAPGVRAELKAQAQAQSSTSPSSPSKTSNSTTTDPASIPKLLEKAQELLVRCEYELAARFVERVLELDPRNEEAVEMSGLVRVEMGDVDGAREAFTTLLALNASKNPPSPPPPSTHLYLAQLAEDPREAITHYQTAVDLLVNSIKGKAAAPNNVNTKDDQLEEEETKRTAIRALVSMVEIYMSDLCFEPEAESQCETYLSIALQLDPDSPEALQSLASVRMSQSRPEEAKDLVGKAWGIWKKTIGNDDGDEKEDDSRPASASPAALLSLTRIFVELSLYDTALEILQTVFAVDDEEVEGWYLQGWCFVLMAERVKESGGKIGGAGAGGEVSKGEGEDEELGWEDLARDARDCLETCRNLHRIQEHGDGALLEHVEELIAELEKAGVQPSPAEGEDGEGGWNGIEEGGEDEWIDEEEDVEMGS